MRNGPFPQPRAEQWLYINIRNNALLDGVVLHYMCTGGITELLMEQSTCLSSQK